MEESLTKIDEEILLSNEDTLQMLDSLLDKWDKSWWDNFYSDKDRKIPFMTEKPDENLVEFVNKELITRGRSLDIGCGNGRNSIYLSSNNFNATAIDLSEESIRIAKEYAQKFESHVHFINDSFFEVSFEDQKFELIHDSGCLHHIKPHRRSEYLSKIDTLLSQNGYFTLTCFNLDGGANISDYDVYKKETMAGGLGYSEKKLVKVLEQYFEVIEIRKMKDMTCGQYYGLSICWAVTMRKRSI